MIYCDFVTAAIIQQLRPKTRQHIFRAFYLWEADCNLIKDFLAAHFNNLALCAQYKRKPQLSFDELDFLRK